MPKLGPNDQRRSRRKKQTIETETSGNPDIRVIKLEF